MFYATKYNNITVAYFCHRSNAYYFYNRKVKGRKIEAKHVQYTAQKLCLCNLTIIGCFEITYLFMVFLKGIIMNSKFVLMHRALLLFVLHAINGIGPDFNSELCRQQDEEVDSSSNSSMSTPLAPDTLEFKKIIADNLGSIFVASENSIVHVLADGSIDTSFFGPLGYRIFVPMWDIMIVDLGLTLDNRVYAFCSAIDEHGRNRIFHVKINLDNKSVEYIIERAIFQ